MVEQIGVAAPSAERTIASISNGVAATISRRLRARAVALRLEADQLDELAIETERQAAPGDPMLGLPAIKARYRRGRHAIKAAADAGKLRVFRGPRGELMARESDLDAWMASAPYAPRAVPAAAAEEDPEAEAMQQLQELARG
jgi:hypothetical protein